MKSLLFLLCSLHGIASTVAFAPTALIAGRAKGAVRLEATAADATSSSNTGSTSDSTQSATTASALKQSLFELLQVETSSNEPRIVQDSVLADPLTKEPLYIQAVPTSRMMWGGGSSTISQWPRTASRNTGRNQVQARVQFRLSAQRPIGSTSNAASNVYAGSSDTFLNLLTPLSNDTPSLTDTTKLFSDVVRPLIPPPLRSTLAGLNMGGPDYVPMRDLFTSPLVSYAYERGWRQGFQAAGFPGPDVEAQLAMDYFGGSHRMTGTPGSTGTGSTIVDMSCATGLFTRRLAASGRYARVLGCDYSASMLTEARRRIVQEQGRPQAQQSSSSTVLDLIQCDVGAIPLQSNRIDAVHAGAAMHCWPDLPRAVSELYRVLAPGGRYFATTFLSSYFGTLQQAEGGATGPSRQAFQYFASTDQLRALLEAGGFAPDKIAIEVLGSACVVIRCEK